MAHLKKKVLQKEYNNQLEKAKTEEKEKLSIKFSKNIYKNYYEELNENENNTNRQQ